MPLLPITETNIHCAAYEYQEQLACAVATAMQQIRSYLLESFSLADRQYQNVLLCTIALGSDAGFANTIKDLFMSVKENCLASNCRKTLASCFFVHALLQSTSQLSLQSMQELLLLLQFKQTDFGSHCEVLAAILLIATVKNASITSFLPAFLDLLLDYTEDRTQSIQVSCSQMRAN
jgi:hypothetical protein